MKDRKLIKEMTKHTLNNYNIAPTFEDRSKERSAEHPTETRIQKF